MHEMSGTVRYHGGPRDGQTYSGVLHRTLEFVMPMEPMPVTWPPEPLSPTVEYRRGWYRLEHDGQWPYPAYRYAFGGPFDERKEAP